jgi:imidazoleglycerol phosphate dehydratase HisB
MRTGEGNRETRETSIIVRVDLDGKGDCDIQSGVPFFDHMLNSFCRHGGFDVTCKAAGDLEVDCHHTIEDIGIVLGDALKQATGEGRGIRRFASISVPMDEALATVALDVGGRGYLVYQGSFYNPLLGGIENNVFEHFFYSLCIRAGINAHISFYGKNDHHQCEALFKAFGIALKDATRITRSADDIPSTKGRL